MNGLTYRRHMGFGYAVGLMELGHSEKPDAAEHPGEFDTTRGRRIAAQDRGRSLLHTRSSCSGFGDVSPTSDERGGGWSRFERGSASFPHRRGIRFCNIRDLTSHFSLAGAKLCEPGKNAVRNGFVSPRPDCGPLAGCAGGGIAADRGIAVGWEAW